MRTALAHFIALVLFLVSVSAPEARAAGEWEWTRGQGWVMGAGASRPTAREQLAHAYELEQGGEFMDSARQYFLLVQHFPSSQEAGIGLQRLARCLFEMENYYTSYKAIEQVIQTYPNSGRMSDLLAIELSIAKKMMVSQTPDLFSGNERDGREANVRRAMEIVDAVIEHDPYGPSAAEAYLVRGEGNLFIGEINAARTAFETVRDEFPRADELIVQRAVLGITRCDSLVGEASPKELQEQLDALRELEAGRRIGPDAAGGDGVDDVDESIRQLAEVEAAKMMEQAAQYRSMGTRAAVKSSEFLYREVVRRYPNTPQAEEAMTLAGNIAIPPEESWFRHNLRNLKLNPFSWNRDPEPPWIVPQMNPDDMVMVDSGIGPIAGVPESGLPVPTAASAGVRPAGLREEEHGRIPFPAETGPEAEVSSRPIPAPSFIDGVGNRNLAFPVGYSPRLVSNPLPTATENDLVPVDAGSVLRSLPGDAGNPAQDAGLVSAPLPDLSPISYSRVPDMQPMLNSLEYNTPLSDLVAPVRSDAGFP
ncbi:MAG: tetratricopeptide repeat protein, partial [Planctomycetota bacterium]|nr:tetratricopeptide repeat protein [Planctomycetota bacterium]